MRERMDISDLASSLGLRRVMEMQEEPPPQSARDEPTLEQQIKEAVEGEEAAKKEALAALATAQQRIDELEKQLRIERQRFQEFESASRKETEQKLEMSRRELILQHDVVQRRKSIEIQDKDSAITALRRSMQSSFGLNQQNKLKCLEIVETASNVCPGVQSSQDSYLKALDSVDRPGTELVIEICDHVVKTLAGHMGFVMDAAVDAERELSEMK